MIDLATFSKQLSQIIKRMHDKMVHLIQNVNKEIKIIKRIKLELCCRKGKQLEQKIQ
jgi:hypothetical protein